MRKLSLIISAIIGIILIMILAFATQQTSENITGASVTGQVKCLPAKAALKFINDKGCERIYEDQGCADKGKVEIRCK